jgi:membrane protein implicated in regulation of membrane protease activity
VHTSLLRHLLRPARGGAAAVVVVFAILMSLALKSGFTGIPLAFLLSSWLFKYAYVLFDHVVRGVDEPPALDITMVNPLNEQRPIGQIIILAAAGALAKLAAAYVSPIAGALLGLTALFFLPASVAILGLEGNLLKAVYPVALGRMVAGLGVMYAAVLGVIAGVILALWLTAKLSLWMPLQIAFGMFAVLSIFSFLGGALYERRHELGLETWHSPERTAENERQADLKQSEHVVTEAYGQVRVGAHANAWDMLQSWLASRGHAVEDYRWVRDRVVSWNDARYADRLTQEYVERLLAAKRDGDALDAVRERLQSDKAFRPKSAAATLHIAKLAAGGGGARGVARVLLSDFGERFAGHPLAASAAALARHLGD